MPSPIFTVLITGAGSGLGLGLCRLWLHRGADVLATVRDVQASRRLLAPLARRTGGRLRLLPLDVASGASLQALGERLRRGGRRIDLLINHASVRQILSLDRLELRRDGRAGLGRAARLRVGFEMLATLRVAYAVMDLLTPGAQVICLTTPPRSASEFGSLQTPPRLSPAALLRSLTALSRDLAGRRSLLALLYPGPEAGPAAPEERLAWTAAVLDELRGLPPPQPARPLLFER